MGCGRVPKCLSRPRVEVVEVACAWVVLLFVDALHHLPDSLECNLPPKQILSQGTSDQEDIMNGKKSNDALRQESEGR